MFFQDHTFRTRAGREKAFFGFLFFVHNSWVRDRDLELQNGL
jgi:hypothetical protein